MSGIFNRTIAHGVHIISDISAIAMERSDNFRKMASDNPALLIRNV